MEPFVLISELGLPIASGLIMGFFIFLVMKQLMDIIRIDTSVSSALNLPPDLDRIARAENFVEDGKIDARRD